MKVIVTGATGFLGANLVRELLSRGYDVDVLFANPTRLSRAWMWCCTPFHCVMNRGRLSRFPK